MEANKIIITGGATRIGAAIAKKLSGQKKEIIIHYNKSKSKAENLKTELTKKISFILKEDQLWGCLEQELKKEKRNGSK